MKRTGITRRMTPPSMGENIVVISQLIRRCLKTHGSGQPYKMPVVGHGGDRFTTSTGSSVYWRPAEDRRFKVETSMSYLFHDGGDSPGERSRSWEGATIVVRLDQRNYFPRMSLQLSTLFIFIRPSIH